MSATPAAYDDETYAHTTARVRWWPAALAFIGLGFIYALVSDRLTVGPRWVLLAVAVVAVIGARVLHWRGIMWATHWVAVGSLVAVTIAVTFSAAFLIQALLNHSTEAGNLLLDAAALWLSNLLTFALWYWEVDGGGPAHRHLTKCGSSDFAFPQRVIGDESDAAWMPEFVDYVFLAFNTSTAFSPTDTMVLARRAKLLMMYQSIVSLVTIAVLAARAINTI
jgi:hypothetical protein